MRFYRKVNMNYVDYLELRLRQYLKKLQAYAIKVVTPLIAGFIANWCLQDRYGLECDVKYEGDCAVEYDGICCRMEYLTLDITTMIGILGGNISLGYTLTRYAVLRLLANQGATQSTSQIE